MCITLGLLLLILAATGASWYYAIIVNLEEVAIASEVSKVYLPEGSFSSMPNLLPISITFKLNLVNVDIGSISLPFRLLRKFSPKLGYVLAYLECRGVYLEGEQLGIFRCRFFCMSLH